MSQGSRVYVETSHPLRHERGQGGDTRVERQDPVFPSTNAAEILLSCLAAGRHTRTVGPGSMDWNSITAVAHAHVLTPLLYVRLKQKGAQDSIPADLWERMRRGYIANAVTGLRRQHILRAVLQSLRSTGIPAIVLKGAHLADAVYGDFALRPMDDIDLLVPKAELPKAHAILFDKSRTDHRPEAATAPGRPGITAVDFHWTIVGPEGRFTVDLAGLWARSRSATIAGVETRVLSPEDMLLHLCLHTSYVHAFGAGLRHLCDIAEATQRFGCELDWEQVAARAQKWRAARFVGLTLELARSMLGADVPSSVLQQLVPGGIESSALHAARECVLTPSGYGPWVPLFHLRSAKTAGDRARLLWERVFISREELALRQVGRGEPGARRLARLRWLRDIVGLQVPSFLRVLQSPEVRQATARMNSVADWMKMG